MAATRAYLTAAEALARTYVDNVAASRAAATAYSATIARECTGVLATLPADNMIAVGDERHFPTPRERGEQDRRSRQRNAIFGEIDAGLTAALVKPDRAAIATFESAIAQLRWSQSTIAELVAKHVAELQRMSTEPTATGVCSDIRAWQQSGYRTLAQITRERAEAHEAGLLSSQSMSSPLYALRAFLDSETVRIEHAIDALKREWLTKLGPSALADVQIRRALGINEGNREPVIQKVVGSGQTRAGGRFQVMRITLPGPPRPCKTTISVQYTPPSNARNPRVSSSFGVDRCSGPPRQPSVSCGDRELTIEAGMPAAVRSVVLHLSGGGTIASRTIIVPKRLGGPLDIYYQALSSKRHPVSLIEFDARGRPLRTLRLHAQACGHSVEPIGPKFFPLVHGTTPSGLPFTVEAEIVTFDGGRDSFGLSASIENPHGAVGSEAGYEEFERHRQPPPFETSIADECPPGEVAIVYGLVREPGATVLARTPSGLVPLTVVAIAADLHAGGSLAYGAFSTYPSELVVRGADGSTLFSESLATREQNHAEFCAGYAEG